ncbi:MAG: hypothetical protein WAS05_05110 [Candidatus Nanopelagicales bacterium]
MSSTETETSPRRRFFLEVFYLSQLGIFLGAIAGIVWGYGAPRSQITGVEGDRVSFDPMSSAPIGADMLFMLIAFLCALILVFVVYKIAFVNPLPTLFGVLIGSALGTLAMYLIGSFLGNMGNSDPTQLAVGETTDAALEINATGVFFVWPFWAAVLVALICWRKSRGLSKELKKIPAYPPVPHA